MKKHFNKYCCRIYIKENNATNKNGIENNNNNNTINSLSISYLLVLMQVIIMINKITYKNTGSTHYIAKTQLAEVESNPTNRILNYRIGIPINR